MNLCQDKKFQTENSSNCFYNNISSYFVVYSGTANVVNVSCYCLFLSREIMCLITYLFFYQRVFQSTCVSSHAFFMNVCLNQHVFHHMLFFYQHVFQSTCVSSHGFFMNMCFSQHVFQSHGFFLSTCVSVNKCFITCLFLYQRAVSRNNSLWYLFGPIDGGTQRGATGNDIKTDKGC